MIASIFSSLRWTGKFPVEVYVEIYEDKDWFAGNNCTYRKTIHVNKDDVIDISEEIYPYKVDYVIYRVQAMVSRDGYRKIHLKTSLPLIGILDDVLNENNQALYDHINESNTQYLVFSVNRNQIPKFQQNTKAQCFFLPIPFIVPYKHMSIQKNNWNDKFPAIAYSGNLQSAHRAGTGEFLLRKNIPTTIVAHNGLTTNPGLVNSFYEGKPPNNFNHFKVMMGYVYETYSTHIASINTPRDPMNFDRLDPGHFVYRITEIIGCQSVLVQHKIPRDSGFYYIFTPGVDCLEWETFEELIDKCLFCVKNSNAAVQIARNGFELLQTRISTTTLRRNMHDYLIYGTNLPDFAEYKYENN